MTECRQESMGKRYYSNGFERPRAERARLYGEIPDDGSVDIVVTHGPPAVLSPWGDEVLKHRIDSMSHPPPFHIFGHDHEHFGVYVEAEGAQLRSMLRKKVCVGQIHGVAARRGFLMLH